MTEISRIGRNLEPKQILIDEYHPKFPTRPNEEFNQMAPDVKKGRKRLREGIGAYYSRGRYGPIPRS